MSIGNGWDDLLTQGADDVNESDDDLNGYTSAIDEVFEDQEKLRIENEKKAKAAQEKAEQERKKKEAEQKEKEKKLKAIKEAEKRKAE